MANGQFRRNIEIIMIFSDITNMHENEKIYKIEEGIEKNFFFV
jgi:hypothetical protein